MRGRVCMGWWGNCRRATCCSKSRSCTKLGVGGRVNVLPSDVGAAGPFVEPGGGGPQGRVWGIVRDSDAPSPSPTRSGTAHSSKSPTSSSSPSSS